MTRNQSIRLTVLGSRGSMPISGDDFTLFGGNTSCYLVEAGNETIILDAGSGLANAPSAFSRAPAILLSHLHVDHLLGLGMYERLAQLGTTTKLYVPTCNTQDARVALDRLYSPPLWPVRLLEYGGDLQVDVLPRTMHIGGVAIETVQSNHPGGCRLIKICFAGKTLVYATDFEHGEEESALLARFSEGADLLLYDGQYDEKRYDAHRGFGHSTPEAGVAIKDRCDVKRLLIVHHDPRSTDAMLLERERMLGRDDVRFAREGEVVEL